MPAAKRSISKAIPEFVIEYFLLGKTRRDALQRYTQDGGIVSDVWLRFAADRGESQRVIVAPSPDTPTMTLGSTLHDALVGYRRGIPGRHELPHVSPLENFVAVTIYFDELLRIVLPLTTWWHRKQLATLQRKAFRSGRTIDQLLEQAILFKLGVGDDESAIREELLTDGEQMPRNQAVLEAAPLAALIGVFCAADTVPGFLTGVEKVDPRLPGGAEKFETWIKKKAHVIAHAAREELSMQLAESLRSSGKQVQKQMEQHFAPREAYAPTLPEDDDEPAELIQRVFLDREGSPAETEDAIAAIKADAASRVFEIACKNITWAVIDSGIARKHDAFLEHGATNRRGQPIDPPPSRVRATYDFTRIQLIRNFDLKQYGEGTPEREKIIDEIIDQLESRRSVPTDIDFRTKAREALRIIAGQLEKKLLPDWNIIEQLIEMHEDDGNKLFSDHGTHVAGILGACWKRTRNGKEETVMQGVCPDIKLYDLRVVHEVERKSTEFALLAALEFVQFLNTRAAQNGPVVHGVNISMSIPHEVSNYGCGATPVCLACDRLSNSGVVVVAAAGNRGWNEQEMGFGSFSFCSITDPGNAREVITVGSTHSQKPHTFGVSYFSSRGPTGDGRLKPDLVAPGEQVRGPIRGAAHDELDGTSMAAPFVSGAAAMLLARHRELIGNAARVKKILCESATDLGREKYFQGHGLVDVLRALQSV